MAKNAVVECFYFRLAPSEEQQPTATVNSLLSQVVGGLEEVPTKIIHAFRDQKETAGNRQLKLNLQLESSQFRQASTLHFSPLVNKVLQFHKCQTIAPTVLAITTHENC